jgi:hypothetical protein
LVLARFEISKHLCHQHVSRALPRVSSARYLPPIKLSVFKKIVLKRLSPIGLYFKLNLSNRWKLSVCACISNVSIDKSYGVRCNDSNTWCNVKCFPSRRMTTSYCQIRWREKPQGRVWVWIWWSGGGVFGSYLTSGGREYLPS